LIPNPRNLDALYSDANGRPKRITRAPGLLSAEVDGEAVIMSLSEGCYFGLDNIASDVWRRLEHGCELSQLVDNLVEDYDASREVIEKDIVNLLRRLIERDLVVLT
jgi:hypothetical protein